MMMMMMIGDVILKAFLFLLFQNIDRWFQIKSHYMNMNKKHSVALVRKRTIPTELPPLVGEVSANFCG
jgi:hypothetical protein